ncbi:hypothetical protein [Paenibacillus koleovorans]|uniref:hypothetical protein n=1 Tax=Paenibacillus koleovorans TaxID=121608 RepID=UPI001FE8FA1A|nr:hypothetical protein [Paenibacillus koleovorans]
MSGNRISQTTRKWLLSLHLLFSGILLGCTVVIVILSITALTTASSDTLRSCYQVMNIVAGSSIRVSSIGMVVTGVLLSVWTHWGLFRYYWLIYKQVMTLASIGVGIIGFYMWSMKGIELVESVGLDAVHSSAYVINAQQLWVGLIFQVISLVSMFVISVFKPWGRRVPRIQ